MKDNATPVNIKQFLLGDDPDTTAYFHGVVFDMQDSEGAAFQRSICTIADCKRTITLHQDMHTIADYDRQIQKLSELIDLLADYNNWLSILKQLKQNLEGGSTV